MENIRDGKRKKNIATIGGGTGSFMVLSALRDYPVNLAAIVSMADDGGSTGRLRDEYGVLPAGDARRALVALSHSSDTLRKLFNFRFNGGGLHGHSFGNLFLAALEKVTGNFDDALQEVSRILRVHGEVVPVTLQNVRLHAQLKDGTHIKGETNIDIPRERGRSSIKRVWLDPAGEINPRVLEILKKADMIIIGPGDLYTSIIPNFLVSGMLASIRRSKAIKVFVGNLMTKFGETDSFGAQDFISEIEKYLGSGVLDYAIFNSKKPAPSVLRRYKKVGAEFVDIKELDLKNNKPQYILKDLIDEGKFIRHNPREKLIKVLTSLL